MAKWGEGDPRWIVEERPDATNVNNWHWTEKNASQWSKDKLRDLFVNLKIESDVGSCRITEIESCEGEAVANNRKAKLIFFYEWALTLKWKGRVKDSDVDVKGKIEIPNLSEEHSPDEVDVNVSVKSSEAEGEILKQMLRTTGTQVIREQLAMYVRCLKEEFSQGMILPTKDQMQAGGAGESGMSPPKSIKPAVNKISVNGIKEQPAKTVGVKLDLEKLSLTETFKCTADELYRALTVKEMVQAFTQGQCVLEAEPGGRFELFDGNVSGTFVQLVPNEKIVQRWRFKTWPEGHHSDVVMDIHQKEDCTELSLTQSNVPRGDLERTTQGWRRYYWDSMKRTFGFGAMLI